MLSGGKSGDDFKGLPIAILSSAGIQRQWVEVEDQGVLAHIDSIDEEIVDSHNQQIFRPFLRIRLEKETSFMGGRMKLLLSRLMKRTRFERPVPIFLYPIARHGPC